MVHPPSLLSGGRRLSLATDLLHRSSFTTHSSQVKKQRLAQSHLTIFLFIYPQQSRRRIQQQAESPLWLPALRPRGPGAQRLHVLLGGINAHLPYMRLEGMAAVAAPWY